MNITSAVFVKGLVGDDQILHDGTAQIAFVGRSNVGKSSIINALARRKDLARSSPTPGRTRQINVYLLNRSLYLVDLPGYGYATGSKQERAELRDLIGWYVLNPDIRHTKVVLIIDAKVGATDLDLAMLAELEDTGKTIVVVANKIDKLKPGQRSKVLNSLQQAIGPHRIIPHSVTEKIGTGELIDVLLK
jgi:GTP-binding protein